VERNIYDTVVERVTQPIDAMTVGNPAAPDTEMGPMANAKQLARVEGYIEQAREAGATITTGGQRLELDDGFYYEPTVVTNVDDTHPVVAEEVFGPVITIQPFDNEEEAISRANATEYGLAAGVQTGDVKRAHRVAKAIQAGLVWVNTYGLLDPAMPFGGVKQSGYGRERGIEGLEAYTQIKSVVFGL
jgi:acyl-CoA reductase-like NAD-dependent aldehyde dehydrogenase